MISPQPGAAGRNALPRRDGTMTGEPRARRLARCRSRSSAAELVDALADALQAEMRAGTSPRSPESSPWPSSRTIRSVPSGANRSSMSMRVAPPVLERVGQRLEADAQQVMLLRRRRAAAACRRRARARRARVPMRHLAREARRAPRRDRGSRAPASADPSPNAASPPGCSAASGARRRATAAPLPATRLKAAGDGLELQRDARPAPARRCRAARARRGVRSFSTAWYCCRLRVGRSPASRTRRRTAASARIATITPVCRIVHHGAAASTRTSPGDRRKSRNDGGGPPWYEYTPVTDNRLPGRICVERVGRLRRRRGRHRTRYRRPAAPGRARVGSVSTLRKLRLHPHQRGVVVGRQHGLRRPRQRRRLRCAPPRP